MVFQLSRASTIVCLMQEKRRPQYNWKEVDNATVLHTMSTLGDGSESAKPERQKSQLEGGRKDLGSGSIGQSQAASDALRESSLRESRGEDVGGVLPRGEDGNKAASQQSTGQGRRRAAEGMRSKQRRSRASSRRASHFIVKNPDLQNR